MLECFQNYRRRYENSLNNLKNRQSRAGKEDHSITAVASSCDAEQGQKDDTTALLQRVANILQICK